jgi:nucleotide-binding universal stress UspA family protein
MNHFSERFIRNILVAVDESENSRRAVSYVADLLEGMPGFRFFVLHIINEPGEDFFASNPEKEAWMQERQQAAKKILADAKDLLLSRGFDPKLVTTRARVRYCPSVAECILNEAKLSQSETIVVGRKGVSRKEEFLFGSVSNRIIHKAKDCTVWVVE